MSNYITYLYLNLISSYTYVPTLGIKKYYTKIRILNINLSNISKIGNTKISLLVFGTKEI